MQFYVKVTFSCCCHQSRVIQVPSPNTKCRFLFLLFLWTENAVSIWGCLRDTPAETSQMGGDVFIMSTSDTQITWQQQKFSSQLDLSCKNHPTQELTS